MPGSDSIRCVRNNNPGNIRKGDPWQGLMDPLDMNEAQRAETAFCVFKNPAFGFRAMARILIAYQDNYEITNLRMAVARWAPPNENDTEAYVRHMLQMTGLRADMSLDFHEYETLAPVVKGFATHEGAGWHFSDGDLQAGLQMAGVIPAAMPAAVQRSALATTAAVATGGAGAIANLATVNDAKDQLVVLGGLGWRWAAIAASLISIGVAVYIGWIHYKEWRRKAGVKVAS